MIPPYFPQSHTYACSLACLRMVLAAKGINISEEDLIQKVTKDYGPNFKNIWNPTIAKLACEYGIPTTMYADWPLFKKEVLPQAITAYQMHPETFNYKQYENPDDTDDEGIPLPLSYKEMFRAIELGCNCIYGQLNEKNIRDNLSNGNYIQTSIKLHLLYPGKKELFHSILLYDIQDETVFYHDPAYGAQLNSSLQQLLTAANSVGAAMIYSK